MTQATEKMIGPYELHDFFLYHFLRFGSPPAKILFLATQAEFSRPYAEGNHGMARASSCAASSPTSSSDRAFPTAPRSARSACRRAATGACLRTPVWPNGCGASRNQDRSVESCTRPTRLD